ncbi:MAG: exodeoxyribonuclease VII small subunit [Alicyclobacillus sp.]|nr:exodeoxyribonuclease VII small subunit [Alicyclobacillus sp.]
MDLRGQGSREGNGRGLNSPDWTFESAMKALEETVKKLESGELSLTESIERYKQAMQLVQFCRQQLDQAEQEIERLLELEPEPSGAEQPGLLKEEA